MSETDPFAVRAGPKISPHPRLMITPDFLLPARSRACLGLRGPGFPAAMAAIGRTSPSLSRPVIAETGCYARPLRPPVCVPRLSDASPVSSSSAAWRTGRKVSRADLWPLDKCAPEAHVKNLSGWDDVRLMPGAGGRGSTTHEGEAAARRTVRSLTFGRQVVSVPSSRIFWGNGEASSRVPA